MSYRNGEQIEVVIDRQGLDINEGIGHLSDNTMVVIVGAGNKVGEAVQATVVNVAMTPLGASVMAYAKS